MTDRISITRYENNKISKTEDPVIIEHKVNIHVDGEFYISLMCLPQDTIELAVGFLFSEGIISSFSDIKTIESTCADDIYVSTASGSTNAERGGRIIVPGFTQGSVKTSFFDNENLPHIDSRREIRSNEITEMAARFNKKSELFLETGAVHSCLLISEGEELFYEDIGRHNALDKTIGMALMTGMQTKNGALMTSGRVSSEMLVKAARVGIPIIISTSAPTSMAVRIAAEMNMTLIGFARGNRFNVYSGDFRVIPFAR